MAESLTADFIPGRDRYARHRAIAGFSQDALQSARVAVIGAGAIGNEVVKNLVLLGVGRIDVFDLDRVELHNLTRSVLLRPEDVGHPKAECVVRRARALDPAVQLEAFVGDIRDTLSVRQARDCTVVIGALDNFEARIRVNQICLLAGTPWVNAAIDSRHATVESFPFATGADAACYECGLPASVYQRIAERHSCGGLQRAAFIERVMPTTIITAALAAARAVEAALAFAMTGATTSPPAEPSSRRWLIDSRSGHASTALLARNPDCPCCGELPRGAQIVTVVADSAAITSAARGAGADRLRLLEPIIWRLACPHCGPTEATDRWWLQPARRVSDAVMRCAQCGDDTVQIELRDLIDLEDFAAATASKSGNIAVTARPMLAAGTCLEWSLPTAVPHPIPPSSPLSE